MTRKKQMDINAIEIDTSNIQEKKEMILNIKYELKHKYKACCVSSYNIYHRLFICQICNHKNCVNFIGFVSDICNNEINSVYIEKECCYVLDTKDSIFMGNYLQTSGINGIMEVCKDKSNIRCGIDVKYDSENSILLEKINGFDRMGLLTSPVLDENENIQSVSYPEITYINKDGSDSNFFHYEKEQSIIRIASKPINMNKVNEIKQQDDKLLRGLRRTNSTTSVSSLSSFRNISITPRKQIINKKEIPKVNIPEQSIFKAYLCPIF